MLPCATWHDWVNKQDPQALQTAGLLNVEQPLNTAGAAAQVDMERDEARRQYRDDQRSKEKQEAWKGKVTSLKQAQATLRATREAYYK